MEIFFLVVMVVAGLSFFAAFIRASRFGLRNKSKLQSLAERSTWWLRLFVRNGYGPEADGERRSIAWHLAASFAATFGAIGLSLLTAVSK